VLEPAQIPVKKENQSVLVMVLGFAFLGLILIWLSFLVKNYKSLEYLGK
jgi:hypothetical protein